MTESSTSRNCHSVLREAGVLLQRIASQGGPLSGNATEMARRCIVEADLIVSESAATVRPNLTLYIVVVRSDERRAVLAAFAADENDAAKIVLGRYTGWTLERVIPKLTRAVIRVHDSDWETEYVER